MVNTLALHSFVMTSRGIHDLLVQQGPCILNFQRLTRFPIKSRGFDREIVEIVVYRVT